MIVIERKSSYEKDVRIWMKENYDAKYECSKDVEKRIISVTCKIQSLGHSSVATLQLPNSNGKQYTEELVDRENTAMKKSSWNCINWIIQTQEPTSTVIDSLQKCKFADIMLHHSPLHQKIVAVDCEFIAIRKGPKWIQHVVEIAIVDLDLNTLFHERCRPDSLPLTGNISNAEFKKND